MGSREGVVARANQAGFVEGWRPAGWPGDRIAIATAGLGLAVLAYMQRSTHHQQNQLESMRTQALLLGRRMPAAEDVDLRLCLVGVLHGK